MESADKLSCFHILVFFLFTYEGTCNIMNNEVTACNLPEGLIKEIASYKQTVKKIIDETTKGASKRFTYDQLATFVDTFGSRIAGSENLETAIDYMLNASKIHNLENVHGERVEIPHWVR